MSKLTLAKKCLRWSVTVGKNEAYTKSIKTRVVVFSPEILAYEYESWLYFKNKTVDFPGVLIFNKWVTEFSKSNRVFENYVYYPQIHTGH